MKNKALFLLAPFILSFAPFASADITLTAGDFVQNTNGTVTHTPTGLIWQACSVGQTWDGTNGTCTGTAKVYGSSGIEITDTFAGKADWRVPNIVELNSIIDLKKSPAINKAIFPQTPTEKGFMSSSYLMTLNNPKDSIWVVRLDDGTDGFYSLTGGMGGYNSYFSTSMGTYNYTDFDNSRNYVRLVRGEALPTTLRLIDFIDNKDGSATHTRTGLTWQRCAIGQIWNDGGCDGKANTFTQDKAIILTSNLAGKTDWRIPTYKELLTIVDYSQNSPATSSIVFPDSPSSAFWTSTQASSSVAAWFVNFGNGAGAYRIKTSELSVRLVRGTMTNTVSSGEVDLFITISGSPSPAIVNGNMTFTATLTNKGTLTATDAKLSFALPKSVSLVTKPTECSFTGLSVLCSVGSLAPSGSVTKSVTVKMAKAGGLTFGVTSWAAEKDTNTADNVARTTVAIRK